MGTAPIKHSTLLRADTAWCGGQGASPPPPWAPPPPPPIPIGAPPPRAHLSQTRTVQAAMIQEEMLKTKSTVPGQMVMRVFMTKRVLKLILLRAPMLRDDASVKSLLCSSMTRPIR